MAVAPVISIIKESGGPPVARGVLISSKFREPAGLFHPRNKRLTELANQEKFRIYIPESGGIPAEWLTPAEVGILDLSDQQLPDLAVVTFTKDPKHHGPEPGEETFSEGATPWMDAAEASRPDEFKQLRELDGSAPPPEVGSTPAGEAAKPQPTPLTLATVWSSFICRYVMRVD